VVGGFGEVHTPVNILVVALSEQVQKLLFHQELSHYPGKSSSVYPEARDAVRRRWFPKWGKNTWKRARDQNSPRIWGGGAAGHTEYSVSIDAQAIGKPMGWVP